MNLSFSNVIVGYWSDSVVLINVGILEEHPWIQGSKAESKSTEIQNSNQSSSNVRKIQRVFKSILLKIKHSEICNPDEKVINIQGLMRIQGE